MFNTKAKAKKKKRLIKLKTKPIKKNCLWKSKERLMMNVEFVEPNFKRELTFAPNDTYFPLQWPHINTGQTVDGAAGTSDADIDSTDAWDIESNSATDTIVAVIDDGVEHNHADLINNMWDGTSCVDDLGAVIVGGCPNHGWDYESLDNDPYGEEHGTFIASIIAGENNNGVGVTGLSR
ncbi:MAG: Peptidase, S8/S53 family, partial [Candidatus Moranbacteria bacterium GW2011_GWF1_34_10]